jgi:hypothetical protein
LSVSVDLFLGEEDFFWNAGDVIIAPFFIEVKFSQEKETVKEIFMAELSEKTKDLLATL